MPAVRPLATAFDARAARGTQVARATGAGVSPRTANRNNNASPQAGD